MKRDKTSACAWEKFFQKPTEEPSLEVGHIVCNNRKLIESIDRKKNLQLNFDSDGKTQRDDILTQAEMKMLFGPSSYSSGEAAEIRSGMRKLICQHPLEWNQNLYSSIRAQAGEYGIPISNEQEIRIQNIATATDIWGKVGAVLRGKGVEITNNCLWFAHPIYFVNHLKRAGLLDFNPYEGKVLIPIVPGEAALSKNHPKDYTAIEVKSCPGFAPVHTKSDGNFPSYLQDATNPNYYWAALNVAFGKSSFYGTKPHLGIDFASKASPRSEFEPGSPIVSMITGKVWAVTWDRNMEYNNLGTRGSGRVMIVKDVNKPILYMLTHLHSCKKAEGEYVYPGEVVAYAGSLGNSSGEHLHLEVFECDADTETGRGSVLVTGKNKPYILPTPEVEKPKQDPGLAWVGAFDHKNKRINPLDHSEK